MSSNALQEQNKKFTERSECPTLPSAKSLTEVEKARRVGLVCPNCGGDLEGRKCKLVCLRRGCGYLVTCSEW